MLNKINLVLKSVDGDDKRGVLTIENGGETLDGKLRLFGFEQEPHGILSLGITSSGEVIKAGLTKKANMLFTFSTTFKELNEDFSCAVVNFAGGEVKPVLFGSANGYTIEKQLDDVLGALKTTQNAEQVEETLDEFGVDYEEDLKQEIHDEIEKNMQEEETTVISSCVGDCNNCVYKQHFYQENDENIEKNQEKTQNNEEIDQNIELPEFYEKIKSQVDKLFAQNKAEEFLQSVIPQSKWVKVELDGGDFYVFGLIYDDDELKYVCYGVPGMYSPLPPKQLSGYPIWFPADKDKKEGFGYWLSYQDASTGESVKAIIE